MASSHVGSKKSQRSGAEPMRELEKRHSNTHDQLTNILSANYDETQPDAIKTRIVEVKILSDTYVKAATAHLKKLVDKGAPAEA